MKKAILKLIGGGILTLAMPAAVISGIVVSTSANPEKYEEEKANLIAEYCLTQEYKDVIKEKEDFYLEAYINGHILPREYLNKLQELNSKSYAENLIVESLNENSQKLNELNKAIDKEKHKRDNGFSLVCAGGLGGAIASVIGYHIAESGYKDIKINKANNSMKKLIKNKQKDHLEIDL